MTYDPSSSGALSYLEAAGELADRGVERAVTPSHRRVSTSRSCPREVHVHE